MKVVVLLSRFPYPLEKGDKLRAFQQIKCLSKHFDIHLICLSKQYVSHAQIEALKPFCSQITVHRLTAFRQFLSLTFAIFNRKPFQVQYFYSSAIKRRIHAEIEHIKPLHIYCQLIRTAEYVKSLHNYTKTIDYMDALGVGMKRIAETRTWHKKFLYREESQRVLRYERLIWDYFEHHTIITQQDRELIIHPQRRNITIISNGVDSDYFTSSIAQNAPKPFDAVFIGNLSYPPNRHTVKLIVEEILPMLPDIKFLVAGANPPAEVLNYQNNQVTVQGNLPDIRTAYSSARLLLAPMEANTGMQNKLLEAMSMNMTCITSAPAAKAIRAEHNINLIICSTPKDYATAVKRALNNEGVTDEIGKNAREFVLEKYSWEATTQPLIEIIQCSAQA